MPHGLRRWSASAEPGHRPDPRFDAEELLGHRGVGVDGRHGHAGRAGELEVHPPGVEHGEGAGGRGHGPIAPALVHRGEAGHDGVPAPAQHLAVHPDRSPVVEVRHRDHQIGGDDPPGQYRQPRQESPHRVEIGHQGPGAQAPARAPVVVVDGDPAAERREALGSSAGGISHRSRRKYSLMWCRRSAGPGAAGPLTAPPGRAAGPRSGVAGGLDGGLAGHPAPRVDHGAQAVVGALVDELDHGALRSRRVTGHRFSAEDRRPGW